MNPNFWHEKWSKKEIGFHQSEAHQLLVNGFKDLELEAGSRVFLPLCGKTLDIAWLLAQGCRVAGAELSQLAVEELFAELGVKPKIVQVGNMKQFTGPNIDIFVGDIFDLTSPVLGPVQAIYDRAAMVALPPEMRIRYSRHLMKITDLAPQLLICFEYDQSLVAGPPFSIDGSEIKNHYQKNYQVTRADGAVVAGGIQGVAPAREQMWILSPAAT